MTYDINTTELIENPNTQLKAMYGDRSLTRFIQKCPHCHNSCTVIMDDRDSLEPCPMCSGGRLRSAEYASGTVAGGNPRSNFINRNGEIVYKPDYYEGVDVSLLSWNRGQNIYQKYGCRRTYCNNPTAQRDGDCKTCQTRSQGRSIPRLSIPEMIQIYREVERIQNYEERIEKIAQKLSESSTIRGTA